MSPIYLPPYFCGINAKLRLKKDLEEEQLYRGDLGTVIEIKGYAYFIKFDLINHSIRMKNGMMEEYFDILDKGEKIIDEFAEELIVMKQPIRVMLKQDLIIKDVITFKSGKTFCAIDETKENGRRFWHLFDGLTNEKILSLREDEFKNYF